MNLYKLEPRFNPKDGTPIKPQQIHIGYICDYSGTIMKFEDETNELISEYSLELNNIGGSEQVWYYDEHPVIDKILLEVEADRYDILSRLNSPHYVFASDRSSKDYSINLMNEWHHNYDNKTHLFYQCINIHKLLRFARYRMIDRLLDNKMAVAELNIL